MTLGTTYAPVGRIADYSSRIRADGDRSSRGHEHDGSVDPGDFSHDQSNVGH